MYAGAWSGGGCGLLGKRSGGNMRDYINLSLYLGKKNRRCYMGGSGSGGCNKFKNLTTEYRRIDSMTYPLKYFFAADTSFIPAGFGERQRTYFLCPECNGRFRYLYFINGKLMCRKCGRLSYRSQTVTHGYDEATRRVYAHLRKMNMDTKRLSRADIECYTPSRPKWQHNKTYKKNIAVLYSLQDKMSDELMKMMYAFVGIDYDRLKECEAYI
jgi:hypothetical protein